MLSVFFAGYWKGRNWSGCGARCYEWTLHLWPFHICWHSSWWGTMFRNIVVHCKFQHSTYRCETIFWVLISYYYKVIELALLNWAKGWSYVSKQAVIAWLHFYLKTYKTQWHVQPSIINRVTDFCLMFKSFLRIRPVERNLWSTRNWVVSLTKGYYLM